MRRLQAISEIRNKIKNRQPSIGTWMQIPHPTVGEILSQSGYDWIALDLEHGSMSTSQLPDIFRAIELGGALPLVRLAEGTMQNCKKALDAGSGGVIVPMVNNADFLKEICRYCKYPPSGNRGVAFSRANLFGKYFDDYIIEAQQPLIVAMIESVEAVKNLDEILKVPGLDAVFIGPYDLSASMNMVGKFDQKEFTDTVKKILNKAIDIGVAPGIHVVSASVDELELRKKDGYLFIAYSIDSVMLSKTAFLS